jgi:hypothetical protein
MLAYAGKGKVMGGLTVVLLALVVPGATQRPRPCH